MSRRQATTIIALLAVIAVLLVAVITYLVGVGGGQDAQQSETVPPSETPVPVETTEQEDVDPVALLEGAGVDVVMAPPVPDAPEEWGDYVLDSSWDGQVRVFEGQGAEPIRGDDDELFPATMNGCGLQMYLVTFRAVAEPVLLDAQLINAAGEPVASEVLNDGWMLGTNCVTPSFVFESSDAEGTLTDVAYTVHRYRQSSVAQNEPQSQAPAPASPAAPAPPVAPAPAAPPAPTLVQCIFGGGSWTGNGLFSDGVYRPAAQCETMRQQEIAEKPYVCPGTDHRVPGPEHCQLSLEPRTGG